MKTIVLGAGETGATTGWFLYEAGHQVTVIDRQPPVGLEISSANDRQISVSRVELRADRSAGFEALQWLTRQNPKAHAPSCSSATAVTDTVNEPRLVEDCTFTSTEALKGAALACEALREAA